MFLKLNSYSIQKLFIKHLPTVSQALWLGMGIQRWENRHGSCPNRAYSAVEKYFEF